jgi:hypothetical protein
MSGAVAAFHRDAEYGRTENLTTVHLQLETGK